MTAVSEEVEIAVTVVPAEVIGSIVFPAAVVVAWFELPSVIQVVELPVVIPVIMLLFTVVAGPLKLANIGTTVPAPVVMLLMVFPLMLLVGPLADEAPSLSLRTVRADAPVSVKFERILLLIA